jgi:hypothetical protein
MSSARSQAAGNEPPSSGFSPCLYSPECVEVEFSEVHLQDGAWNRPGEASRKFLRAGMPCGRPLDVGGANKYAQSCTLLK